MIMFITKKMNHQPTVHVVSVRVFVHLYLFVFVFVYFNCEVGLTRVFPTEQMNHPPTVSCLFYHSASFSLIGGTVIFLEFSNC